MYKKWDFNVIDEIFREKGGRFPLKTFANLTTPTDLLKNIDESL